MGVKVRQKTKGKGQPYWVFINHKGKRKSLKVGDKRAAEQLASQIREKIKTSGARCVFREPQFEPRLLSMLTEGTGAGIGTLAPLGADLPAGPEAYFLLMHHLGDSLRDCLAGAAKPGGGKTP